jgi:hypothetical protein
MLEAGVQLYGQEKQQEGNELDETSQPAHAHTSVALPAITDVCVRSNASDLVAVCAV